MPKKGELDYSVELELDLATVVPSVAGPKRPQDRIELPNLKREFLAALTRPITESGFGRAPGEVSKSFTVSAKEGFHHGGGSQEPVSRRESQVHNTNPMTELEMTNNRPTPDTMVASGVGHGGEIRHGSVLIAAITSCTNTSNPSVMLAAGLLAKKAVERGLQVNPLVKASLAPGSRVVTDYLNQTGLQKYLDQLGFNLVGYGCTTCIGNSGPLPAPVDEAIGKYDLIAASVLSGNRNFEARVHQSIKANFLMSPPLVVAFALAGRVDIDLSREPIGKGKDGEDVYLKDLWPTLQEVRDLMQAALKPDVFRRLYRDFAGQNPKWNQIPTTAGNVYQWDANSTYIQEPPFFLKFDLQPGEIREISGARPLAIFGDSVTTDHISPAGSIKKTSPAGKYLIEHGVGAEDFNSYGSRRGNDRVMTRGTFANVRIKNLMVPGTEGGVTRCFASKGCECAPDEMVSIYEASMAYQNEGTPLVVLAGQEYGTGSSRDWAAKGTALLGVKAVVAQSFERIHRSNLVGMGVLPLQFKEGTNAQTLKLDGTERFDVLGLGSGLKPQQDLNLRLTRGNGQVATVPVTCRIDTPIEVDYYQHGGILPYVLRQLAAIQDAASAAPAKG
jgi:aconitate hydratase